jgi:hypothetical protein
LALALYFLLWSPQLNIRDVPHWSAVSVRNVPPPLKKIVDCLVHLRDN